MLKLFYSPRSTIHGFTLIELLIARHPKLQRRKAILGFTLIELLVVMGIFAIMFGFASINLLRPQTQANLDTTLSTIVADLKEQQIRAMTGNGPSAYGVYFEPSRYTLFTGSIYSAGAADNFSVNLEGGITISPTTSVVFVRRSGQTTATTLTITNTNSSEQKTITINTLGAVTIQ
ncbi:hypothetical protein A3A60_02000 [Candidatus Curtissbacteria bacterium RIFCSPLOWO2_01_FULL_42_26]|uniref:General secretion pathway GspH domain-containing protein n=1 Tax=Candidatus Curtissbacteria bacterium RIFCSPLOWO2_01_FULL_42_26 TaxID=1797729 RepID=A0A1F5I4F3_9BACT|nr:MAG: hypothetical protein A3A60_02000 [Candidatus Curtissbacteria bacterium RIFCSPLOWO2_01_FULL_42_26]